VKVYRGADCLRLLREAGFPRTEIDRYKISPSWGLMTVKAANDARPLPLAHRTPVTVAL
jgi:hypothetical protein